MDTYVVPARVRRPEPAPAATSTVVVCGAPEHLGHTDVRALAGDDFDVLTSATALREYADRHGAPDVAVIVTPLPDGPVLPLIRMLRTRGWQRVVVLSGKADARAIHATLVSGVRGVIVRRQSEGRAAPVPPSGAASLSERELEVLRMVADGQTNRCVGERLGVSALTVKSHLARIARKLGSGDRAEMVANAIRCGYIA